MKTVYLAIAREDDYETSSKVVGMYNSVESAKADLSKRFINLRDSSKNKFLWHVQQYTNTQCHDIAYFYGDNPSVGFGNGRHEIVILAQKVDV